jgi:hypothetical protein
VSHAAIAAVLAMSEATVGERLTAFSLASFASREQRAWPSTRVAAARAGLSRSQYLAARDRLVRHSLVIVEAPGGGRGRAAIVSLAFAEAGPWLESDINAELVEAVLSHSRSRGAARVLFATLAALADRECAVAGFSSDEIRRAASMADSTYRRARAALLSSGEIALTTAGGGRANTNQWVIRDPRSVNPAPLVAVRTRPAPPAGARPLIATARPLTSEPQEQLALPRAEGSTTAREAGGRSEADLANPGQNRTVSALKGPGLSGVSALNPAQDRTVSTAKGPGLSGVSALIPAQDRTVSTAKGPGLSGVSAPNPGQDRTVSRETPPQTPPETPPPDVRAGREPQNPRIRKDPPTPPEGGRDRAKVLIQEEYVTARGRRRRRAVPVDIDVVRRELRIPGVDDRGDWEQVRRRLRDLVEGSVFEIWLEGVELIAVDRDGGLVVAGPLAVSGWVKSRFGPVLSASARAVGREVRLADERERAAVEREGQGGGDHRRAVVNQQEVS